MPRLFSNLFYICLILVACAIVSFAQADTITLKGIVVDQNGAPIPAAQVFLYASPTLLAQTSTGPTGEFTFTEIKIDHGVLRVRATGFAEAEQSWTTADAPLRVTLAPLPLREVVVVTPTRTGIQLGETSASVAVVSSETLEQTAALRLDDALRQVVGFQVFRRSGSRTANPTTQGISLRGTGASGASRALMLFDGIPLNDPFGGWIYWGRVPRESVDQVEVLRGGASYLYGGTALGGVVNVLSQTPERSALAAEVSYGNERTPGGSLFGSLTNGKWTASLGAEISSTEGYIIVDEDERGPIDTPAGSRYSAVNLKVERAIGETGSVFIRGETLRRIARKRNAATNQSHTPAPVERRRELREQTTRCFQLSFLRRHTVVRSNLYSSHGGSKQRIANARATRALAKHRLDGAMVAHSRIETHAGNRRRRPRSARRERRARLRAKPSFVLHRRRRTRANLWCVRGRLLPSQLAIVSYSRRTIRPLARVCRAIDNHVPSTSPNQRQRRKHSLTAPKLLSARKYRSSTHRPIAFR